MVLVQIHKGIKLAAQNAFAGGQEAIVRLRSFTIIDSDEMEKCAAKHEARYRNNNYGNRSLPMWVHDC